MTHHIRQDHCHLGLGKLYRRTDKRDQAQEHLTTAMTMYRDMDMGFWLEKAEAEMLSWDRRGTRSLRHDVRFQVLKKLLSNLRPTSPLAHKSGAPSIGLQPQLEVLRTSHRAVKRDGWLSR
jgi:hypothetical protein